MISKDAELFNQTLYCICMSFSACFFCLKTLFIYCPTLAVIVGVRYSK